MFMALVVVMVPRGSEIASAFHHISDREVEQDILSFGGREGYLWGLVVVFTCGVV